MEIAHILFTQFQLRNQNLEKYSIPTKTVIKTLICDMGEK